MRVKFLSITVILFICLFSYAAENNNQLEGTWELISGKIILSVKTIDTTPGEFERVIKIINKTHFATIGQDTSKQESYFNAGNYSLSENVYTENLELFSKISLIGSSLSYKIKIEGDQLTMSGPLKKKGEEEPGWQLHEVWKKIK